MTGMAVLLLARPIVRHRDRFAQSDERGDGWSADEGHLVRAREHRGSTAGFLLDHHLDSGRPRRSDGSVAAVRHDDVAGDVSFGTPPAAKARQRTTASHEYRRDAVPGSVTALEHFSPSRLPATSDRLGSRAVLAGSPSPLMGPAHYHVDPTAAA